jgi:hypothetical protein
MHGVLKGADYVGALNRRTRTPCILGLRCINLTPRQLSPAAMDPLARPGLLGALFALAGMGVDLLFMRGVYRREWHPFRLRCIGSRWG